MSSGAGAQCQCLVCNIPSEDQAAVIGDKATPWRAQYQHSRSIAEQSAICCRRGILQRDAITEKQPPNHDVSRRQHSVPS